MPQDARKEYSPYEGEEIEPLFSFIIHELEEEWMMVFLRRLNFERTNGKRMQSSPRTNERDLSDAGT